MDATQLQQLSPDMPELLRELGIKYDPDRLAQVLKSRGGQVRARAVQITASVGAFLARILKVLLTGSVTHSVCHDVVVSADLIDFTLVDTVQILSVHFEIRPFSSQLAEIMVNLACYIV